MADSSNINSSISKKRHKQRCKISFSLLICVAIVTQVAQQSVVLLTWHQDPIDTPDGVGTTSSNVPALPSNQQAGLTSTSQRLLQVPPPRRQQQATINSTSPVLAITPLKKKKKKTELDYRCAKKDPLLDEFLQIASPPSSNSSSTSTKNQVLCFVMTCRDFHHSRVKAIRGTWGHKCDELLIFSDSPDPTDPRVIPLNVSSQYDDLWTKLGLALNYIVDPSHSYLDRFDWFFKLDDDTFVLWENLQHFLHQPQVQRLHQSRRALIYGRRYSWVLAGDLKRGKPPHETIFYNHTSSTGSAPGTADLYQPPQQNRDFAAKFFTKYADLDIVEYLHGGAGYLMNRVYVQRFQHIREHSSDTLIGRVPEDLAHGIVMGYHGYLPQSSTLLVLGDENKNIPLQTFHVEPLPYMYNAPVEAIQRLTGGRFPEEPSYNTTACCSPYSLTFHHVNPMQMWNMYYRLYDCREWRRQRNIKGNNKKPV